MLESYSNRMLEFSKKADFTGREGDFFVECRFDDSIVQLYCTVNRGRFTKILFETEDTTPKRAIYFGICRLLTGADLTRVKEFNSRELDSFLRDQNHIECIGSGFPHEDVMRVTSKLLAGLFTFELDSEVDDWSVESDSSYVEKISALTDFLTIKVNILDLVHTQNLEIHLVNLTESEVFIEFKSTVNGLKLSPTSLSKEILSSLEGIVRRIIGSESVKLVAE